MAGKGREFIFHGAFKTKKKAVRREKKGEFIRSAMIRGTRRFLLLSKRGK